MKSFTRLCTCLGAFAAMAVTAQAEMSSLPLCQTSSETAGLGFSGFYNLVHSPVDVAQMTFTGDAAEEFSYIAEASGDPRLAMVYISEAVEEGTGAGVVIRDAEGASLYTCVLQVTQFRYQQHDTAELSYGSCNLTLQSGPEHLVARMAQVFEIEAFADISTATQHLDISPIDERTLYVLGKHPGWGQIALIAQTGVPSLCPFEVWPQDRYFEMTDVDDMEFCQNENGDPARLTIGDTMLVRPEPGSTDMAVADPDIVRMRWVRGDSIRVDALEVGLTSLTTVSGRKTTGTCLILVE